MPELLSTGENHVQPRTSPEDNVPRSPSVSIKSLPVTAFPIGRNW